MRSKDITTTHLLGKQQPCSGYREPDNPPVEPALQMVFPKLLLIHSQGRSFWVLETLSSRRSPNPKSTLAQFLPSILSFRTRIVKYRSFKDL